VLAGSRRRSADLRPARRAAGSDGVRVAGRRGRIDRAASSAGMFFDDNAGTPPADFTESRSMGAGVR
jgi:hypothetical protein